MLEQNTPDSIPRKFLDEYRTRIAGGELDLPLLPGVAARVLELASSDRGNAAEFSELIHKDQALAGQVLRVANSAVFQRRGAIVSLKQAVTRLGLDLLSEIAMTSILGRTVFRTDGFENLVRQIWRHALATGCFAKEIARTGRRNVESAFLCGLLHSIGKPIALNTAIALMDERGVALGEPTLAELLELTHQGVGVRIAAKWSLPEPVGTCILCYSDYVAARDHREQAATIYLATRLASLLTTPGTSLDDETGEDPVYGELNLYPDDVSRLLAIGEHVTAIVDTLDQGVV